MHPIREKHKEISASKHKFLNANVCAQELRDELEARSLDKTGTKPVLVERLEAALADEPPSVDAVESEPAVEASGVTAVDAPQTEPQETVRWPE